MILHYGDLIDGNCLVKIINDTKPTEIYNLGAQSHVKVGKWWILIQIDFIQFLCKNQTLGHGLQLFVKVLHYHSLTKSFHFPMCRRPPGS